MTDRDDPRAPLRTRCWVAGTAFYWGFHDPAPVGIGHWWYCRRCGAHWEER
jgi:hypothetical protein